MINKEDGDDVQHYGAVSECCNIRNLVEDSAAGVYTIAEHYYVERMPSVEVTDGELVIAAAAAAVVVVVVE